MRTPYASQSGLPYTCGRPTNTWDCSQLYLGETEIDIGGNKFEFGATSLTGGKLLVTLAAIGTLIALVAFHRKRKT